jgi:hypothetical protein
MILALAGPPGLVGKPRFEQPYQTTKTAPLRKGRIVLSGTSGCVGLPKPTAANALRIKEFTP